MVEREVVWLKGRWCDLVEGVDRVKFRLNPLFL